MKILNYLVCSLWQKIQSHINTDFTVTGWMLCDIPHIIKYENYHSDSDIRKQFINVFKKLFHGLSLDKMTVTQDIFWTEYTEFDNKNVSLDGD